MAEPQCSTCEELTALFELQQTRMVQATAMWRAEDPEARALVAPDLGKLLDWLMAKAQPAPPLHAVGTCAMCDNAYVAGQPHEQYSQPDPFEAIPPEHREALADHADAAFAYTSYLAGENEPAEAKRLRDTHQMAALNLYALNAHVHLPAVAEALRGVDV